MFKFTLPYCPHTTLRSIIRIFTGWGIFTHLILDSAADVEPPELDSVLDAIETGLGLRDDAPELASDTVNWH